MQVITIAVSIATTKLCLSVGMSSVLFIACSSRSRSAAAVSIAEHNKLVTHPRTDYHWRYMYWITFLVRASLTSSFSNLYFGLSTGSSNWKVRLEHQLAVHVSRYKHFSHNDMHMSLVSKEIANTHCGWSAQLAWINDHSLIGVNLAPQTINTAKRFTIIVADLQKLLPCPNLLVLITIIINN